MRVCVDCNFHEISRSYIWLNLPPKSLGFLGFSWRVCAASRLLVWACSKQQDKAFLILSWIILYPTVAIASALFHPSTRFYDFSLQGKNEPCIGFLASWDPGLIHSSSVRLSSSAPSAKTSWPSSLSAPRLYGGRHDQELFKKICRNVWDWINRIKAQSDSFNVEARRRSASVDCFDKLTWPVEEPFVALVELAPPPLALGFEAALVGVVPAHDLLLLDLRGRESGLSACKALTTALIFFIFLSHVLVCQAPYFFQSLGTDNDYYAYIIFQIGSSLFEENKLAFLET